MQSHTSTFHLLIERSEYQSRDITELEPLLADFLEQEQMGKLTKTKVVTLKELSKEQQLDLGIDDTRINEQPIINVHIYNHLTAIIETVSPPPPTASL